MILSPSHANCVESVAVRTTRPYPFPSKAGANPIDPPVAALVPCANAPLLQQSKMMVCRRERLWSIISRTKSAFMAVERNLARFVFFTARNRDPESSLTPCPEK